MFLSELHFCICMGILVIIINLCREKQVFRYFDYLPKILYFTAENREKVWSSFLRLERRENLFPANLQIFQ